MTDIVERLRLHGERARTGYMEIPVFDQAADEIVRLREALTFYADQSDYVSPYTGGMGKLWKDCGRVARVALKGNTP